MYCHRLYPQCTPTTIRWRESFSVSSSGFICMVSVGSKEKDEAEALLATADPYVRALYERSADSSMGRWLMIEITSEGILRDAEALMLLCAAPKGARS